MSFKPLNTKDDSNSYRKTLLVAPAGWGKTTQARNFQRAYGPGFIISGESGLASIRSAGIDYLPFTSFDGEVNPSQNIYSFTEVVRQIKSPEFQAMGYRWIMLDSITELSDLTFAWAEARAQKEAIEANKKMNGFDVWQYYKEAMIGGCKFIRDLPYHVVLSALEQSTKDDNDDDEIVPLVQGNAVKGQLPGIFDNVMFGVSKTLVSKDAAGVETRSTQRFVVTGHYSARKGKVRDEHGVVQLVETTGDITTILQKIEAAENAA